MTELVGTHTFIRPPQSRDWSAWAELRSRSRAFLEPWEPAWPADSLTRAAWDTRFKRQQEEMQRGLSYSFLSFRKTDGALVGGLSLTNVRRGVSQSALLGYWVGQPFARQGHTFDSVSLLLDYALSPALGLHRVEAGCLPRNLASRGLLKKLGFQEEGVARAYLRINNVWEDHLMFSMLDDDWRKKQNDETPIRHALGL